MTDHLLRARALSLLASLILFSALLATDAKAQEEQVLNYRNAEVRAFIDDMSLLTGRMFIVDPRVSGNVTVISHEPLPADDLFDVFFATLQVNGYSAVPTTSGAYKIVPNKIAAEQADRENGARSPEERFVTEVFQLQSANALTALNLVEPIVHSDGRAVANRDSDYLIVVDYAANMERIRKVVNEIDRDNSVVETIKLKNIAAREMARLISQLGETQNEGRGGARFTVVPVEASNAIMIRGEPAAVVRMLPVIRSLDESNEARSDIRVVYLNHANAIELVPLLDQISTSLLEATSGPDAASATRRAAIAAHKGTNSLIINADPDMQNALAGVISRLDVRRAQVLVEAIIVEVTDVAARQLGLQYLIAGSEGSNVPFTATNFTNTGPNLLAATGAVLLRNKEGFDEDVIDGLQQAAVDSLIGLNGFSGGFAGETSDGSVFGVIVNALKNDIDSNILSTPSLMTMDNEEASIIVGQEVPITRG
ncbi:MAG: secretin N-terminal domain-containing protein, partial [Alphaproteobacteria bacterium]|nr:secretin N-terminal domain-containing protein [Alphaproteobacteria bacterium]